MSIMTVIQCPRCGHLWNPRSKLWKINCPSCGKQVDNPNVTKEQREAKING